VTDNEHDANAHYDDCPHAGSAEVPTDVCGCWQRNAGETIESLQAQLAERDAEVERLRGLVKSGYAEGGYRMIEWDDFVVCPLCGYENKDYRDYPGNLRHDGDVAEMKCPHCDEFMQVIVRISPTYVTFPPRSIESNPDPTSLSESPH